METTWGNLQTVGITPHCLTEAALLFTSILPAGICKGCINMQFPVRLLLRCWRFHLQKFTYEFNIHGSVHRSMNQEK